MKDFSSAVNAAMQAMIDSGKVEEIIKAKLEKTVDEAISDALRSYSDFGKDLKKHVEASLKIDVSNVNLQEYGQVVLKMVEGLVNKHVQESAQGKLLEQLNSLFETPPPRITLQELLDAYKEGEEDSAHSNGYERCGLIIEESDSGYIYVGFNPSDEEGSHFGSSTKRIEKVSKCEIQLHFSKPKDATDAYAIRWISFGGYRGETTKNFMPTSLHGLARRLYQMYCAGTMVVIDSLDSYNYERAYSWTD